MDEQRISDLADAMTDELMCYIKQDVTRDSVYRVVKAKIELVLAANVPAPRPKCPRCGSTRTEPTSDGRWTCHALNGCLEEFEPFAAAPAEERRKVLQRGEGLTQGDCYREALESIAANSSDINAREEAIEALAEGQHLPLAVAYTVSQPPVMTQDDYLPTPDTSNAKLLRVKNSRLVAHMPDPDCSIPGAHRADECGRAAPIADSGASTSKDNCGGKP